MNGLVKNVALLWSETSLANQVTQHLFVSTIVRAGGRDNIFLDHDRTHVVGAKPQRHLTQFQPLR